MAEHYPRGVTEVTAYCEKCGRFTQHRVDHPPAGEKGGGRRGPCMEHEAQAMTKAQIERREKRERLRRQPDLFET